MRHGGIHVFGGTSEARQLCSLLDARGMPYSLSVATDTGKNLAAALQGDIHVGRLDAEAMIEWLRTRHIGWVIDAAHPYATQLRVNVREACRVLQVPLLRYERPSELAAIRDPLLIMVADTAAACEAARGCGPRVLLTTGSKDLAHYRAALADKTLIARVLPTANVLRECEALGFGVETLIAMKGPFDAALNAAIYRQCAADVVITKESGAEGGYQDKIRPALALGIPCIVIRRPAQSAAETADSVVYGDVISSAEEFEACLQARERQL